MIKELQNAGKDNAVYLDFEDYRLEKIKTEDLEYLTKVATRNCSLKRMENSHSSSTRYRMCPLGGNGCGLSRTRANTI